MKNLVYVILLLISSNSIADYKVDGNKLIPTDSFGNRRWSDTNYKVDGNKYIPTDSFGNRKWNAVNYRSESGKKVTVDSFNNRIYKW
jgi:hypothetical protein